MAKFIIDQQRTVKNWPWHIPVPGDNGSVTSFRGGLDFKLPGKEEYQTFIQSLDEDGDGDLPNDLIAADTALTDYIISHVTGWHGFVHKDGDTSDADYSEAALRQVLDQINTSKSFHESFNAAVEGRRVKN